MSLCGRLVSLLLFIQGVSEKSTPPKKTIWTIFISVKSFCVKFCKFVGNSYPRIYTNFCRFILIFHHMALIIPRVTIVFTLSSFDYSTIKWKCRGRSPTAWFTQNGRASVVDSTADFHNRVLQCSTYTLCQGNWKYNTIQYNIKY